MNIFRIPASCAAILFDLDCTLYTHPEYARLQTDLLVERLAERKGKDFTIMQKEVDDFRRQWSAAHNGAQISLGNTFTHFGVTFAENVRWREELYQPERYLTQDMQLRSTLEQLRTRFVLAIVSNNAVSIVRRTLAVLGVDDLFHEVVGLDTCGVSKPHEEPFLRAAMRCGAVPESCVAVGDRYDIDIALPLEMGMGGILVDGVIDVYKLAKSFTL